MGRLAMARLCPDAFPGTRRWQNAREMRSPGVRRWRDCALMRSWPDWQWQYSRAIRSRGLAVARFRPDAFPGVNPWQVFHSMHPESGLGREKGGLRGKIRTPCIRNELALARYARHASEMPRKLPLKDTPREDLAGRGPFRCTGPSNHARRADLAIRRRTARAIATTAPPLWAAERGAGGFLSGGVTLPKECVVLWGVERWRQSWHQ